MGFCQGDGPPLSIKVHVGSMSDAWVQQWRSLFRAPPSTVQKTFPSPSRSSRFSLATTGAYRISWFAGWSSIGAVDTFILSLVSLCLRYLFKFWAERKARQLSSFFCSYFVRGYKWSYRKRRVQRWEVRPQRYYWGGVGYYSSIV